MEHSSPLPYLRETLLFLTLAGILIPLLQRFRINQILGFLIIGLIVGPHGIGHLTAQWPWLETFTFPTLQAALSLRELGIISLMFLIGLELSAERLWALRRWVFWGGSAQVLLSALAIGGCAWVFGNSGHVSLLLGLLLALSSTAVVMQLLSQQRTLATPLGQSTFAILMLQDFAVVPLLILVDLLARESVAGMPLLIGTTLIKSVLAVALIMVVGRRLVAPVFRYFSAQRQPEVFVALTLLAALGTAWITAEAGLSLALGAFLAGVLLAETEYRHEVEVTIEPFKGLLMGLFFMSVGMGIDIGELIRQPLWIPLSVLGLLLIKSVVATAVLRSGGLSWGKAVEGGLLLSQGGEFAFVVVGYAATAGLLSADISQFMLLVVSLSLLLATLVARLGKWLGGLIDRDASGEPIPDSVEPGALDHHIVIAGFGRVGQLLAHVLEAQNVPYVAIEHNAHLVARLRKRGKPVFHGDAARGDLLRKLHTGRAAALLITMDQPVAAMHAVRAARSEYGTLAIYARSRDEHHARELRDAGATAVVPETLEAGLQLSAFALQALALPDADIALALDAEREARLSRP